MNNWIKKNSGKMLHDKDGYTLFVFNWTALSKNQKDYLVEYQLLELAEKILSEGNKIYKILGNDIIPFALLSPEELEPDELFDFDVQSDGVLFLNGNTIVHCPESSSSELTIYAKSIDEVAIKFSE